jgi:chromosome partitioning protein
MTDKSVMDGWITHGGDATAVTPGPISECLSTLSLAGRHPYTPKRMGRVIALANQKGGVAKTTSVHALGVALAERGQRVLLVDLDPQACLTFSNGIDPDSLTLSVHDVMLERACAVDVIQKVDAVHLLPSSIDLAGAEIHLLSRTGREYVLRRALAPLRDQYDVVLLDCPPSLGILTINGLTAAGDVLIPLQCETLSHRGVGQLLETIEDVRSYTNPDLRVAGVIATMYDGRTKLAGRMIEAVRENYGLEVLEPPVPKSVRVAEAPGVGASILTHAPSSKVAEAYRELAGRLVAATVA